MEDGGVSKASVPSVDDGAAIVVEALTTVAVVHRKPLTPNEPNSGCDSIAKLLRDWIRLDTNTFSHVI